MLKLLNAFCIGSVSLGPLLPDDSSATLPGTIRLMLVALLYLMLGGAYLFVMPLAIFFLLKQRWYVASSIERVFLYFLVFLFFPGLLVLAPFLNFRPAKRAIPN